jgi:hypothetical protein
MRESLTLIYDRSRTASIVVSSLLLTGYADAKLLHTIHTGFQSVNDPVDSSYVYTALCPARMSVRRAAAETIPDAVY